jgi:hypothetical protein
LTPTTWSKEERFPLSSFFSSLFAFIVIADAFPVVFLFQSTNKRTAPAVALCLCANHKKRLSF